MEEDKAQKLALLQKNAKPYLRGWLQLFDNINRHNIGKKIDLNYLL